MADVPPASAVSPVSATAAAPSSNNIVIETAVGNAPDKIQQLTRQIEVSGTLAGPPANNAITLNTMIGPITLLLPQLAQVQQDKMLQQLIAIFQNQKALTVVMQPGNPPSQAFLLLPSNPTPVQTVQQQTAGIVNFLQPSTAAQEAPPLLPNITVSAVVLPDGLDIPAPPSVNLTGQAGQIPYAALNPAINPGLTPAGNPPVYKPPAQIPVNPAPALPELPSLPTNNLFAANMPNAALPSAIANAVASNTPAQTLQSLFQPGTELNLQIDSIIPPAAQGAAPPPEPQAPNQVLATVVGNGPGGQLILKTGDASLFVRQPASLPAGTQLLLTVEPAHVDTLLTLPQIQQFPALQQAMAALAQIDPNAARTLLATRVPQGDDGLPGTLLFFLNAVGQGNVRSWLGNSAFDTLTRAGKAELIGKLMQEFQQTEQTVHDNVVGEWRSYTVPLHDNSQFTAMHIYVHGDRERHASRQSGGKPGGPSQVRFLIDIRMSRIGALQLDGFLRPKQLDIIVRSESRLPPNLANDLRTTYARTLEAIGYNGALSFQNGRQSWLNIQKPAPMQGMVT